MSGPHQVTKDFERALCEYTGAKYAVAVNSCTMALLIACAWFRKINGPTVISVPKFTYPGVPMSILHSGNRLEFRNEVWRGAYQLEPLPVWDCARRFTSAMYVPGQFQCCSFHWAKILGVQQGGVILHDDEEADAWFRRARFDGRTEGVATKDDTYMMGWHAYMSPEVAAAGLMRLSILPKHNEDLDIPDYPDLSKQEIFK